MIKLTKEKTIALHEMMANATGGDTGVRDHALLESALSSAFATFGGVDLYPTALEKGVRLGYSLISNHAFVDGNKRIGMFVMLVFLELNNISLSLSDEDVYQIGMRVAAGEMGYEEMLRCLMQIQGTASPK